MSMMTVERLHDLLDENSEKDVLGWAGSCHDCQKETNVTASPETEGIRIEGGSVYEPENNKF